MFHLQKKKKKIILFSFWDFINLLSSDFVTSLHTYFGHCKACTSIIIPMLQSRAGFIKQYQEIKQNWARPENFDTSCCVIVDH